jgi:Leucine-rich repeat (LRR) protein
MTSPLLSLPQDILCFVSNYLLPELEQNRRIFNFSYDWRNFLSSNKEYFGKWKKESQIIVLTDSDAKSFRDLKGFREKVYECVENPRLQLDVVFDGREESHPLFDLQSLGSMRKCHLTYYDCVAPPTMDVDEIALLQCQIEDYSFCSNFKSVEVFQLSNKPFKGILDFSLFQNIEKGCFRINSAPTVNHHLLANLKSLVLRCCPAITDVSCFQNIPHLSLILCFGITDVSSLGRVHTLNLRGCENIRDVSALGRVHTLDLSHCTEVTDLSALEWVYSLTFLRFAGTDLSKLKNVIFLDIRGAASVTDITMLHSLQVLKIGQCENIFSLKGLPRLKQLWMQESDLRRITTGNEVFPRLVTLHLGDAHSSLCSQFLQTLNHLQVLSLQSYDWDNSSCISVLTGLRSLTLSYCGGFTTLPPLPSSLGYLKIIGCGPESLTIARKDGAGFPLYDLIIEDCPFLKKLQIDGKVFKCRIVGCPGLNTIVVNEQIGHLRMQDVETLEKIVNWSKVVSPELFFYQDRVLTVNPENELVIGKTIG